jgi:hypothetical protein
MALPPKTEIALLTERVAAQEACCRELMAAFGALVEFLPILTLPGSRDMARRDDAVRRIKQALDRAGRVYG